MSDKTTGNLQLEKPGNGEYQNNWDIPLNNNSDTIDAHMTAIETEIASARGNKSSLVERLDNAMDSDGNPLAVPETEKSRNSQISGRFNDTYLRHNALDQELLWLRHQGATFIDGLKYLNMGLADTPISGPLSGNNAACLTAAGAVFTVDGNPTPVVLNCGGYAQICRIDNATDITGQASGTKYVYAQRNSSGRVVESGSDGASGGSVLNEFSSVGAQFQTRKVQPGDLLVISAGTNADTYVVNTVDSETTLTIKGAFVAAVGSQTYQIKDMLHPTISFESTKSPADGKCYIGELEFDGATITSTRSYSYKHEYASSWTAVDISAVPTFTQLFNHNMGVLPKQVLVYASQGNDEYASGFTAELLSVADVNSDYALGFNAGTGDSSVAPTGGPYPTRSVKAQITRNTITLKNVRDNLFYVDYAGTTRQAGYIKVIVRG